MSSARPAIYSFLVCVAFSSLVVGSEQGFFLDVPFVHQEPGLCGAAALSMVFDYWGFARTQRQIAEDVSIRRGMSGVELKSVAARHDFEAHSFRGETAAMKRLVRKGWPLIVAIDAPGQVAFHFVLLVGWDDAGGEWIVHDPARGPYRRMPATVLAERHHKANGWSLLVAPQRSSR